ncbi:MAG: DNA repair exonuclease [Patescibacteria group bacterium]|nr:DNA repair exonuclease [Patescibacteria group bacterium]
MKFIHLADSHLDGFKEQRLSDLGFENFRYCISFAIEKQVDFVLIAGDLFNSAIPRIDTIKETTKELKKLKDLNIPVYYIPGSHDFSINGRTMLEVLEFAGLLINVMKGEIVDEKLNLKYLTDKKTGAKITGIMGKKGMLDKEYYENLIVPEKDDSFHIFMFHTAITELRPKKLEKMESYPVSFLPNGFDYYAGGHVHIRDRYSGIEHKNVVYPGPTFPNNFSELEELEYGSFIYYDDSNKEKPYEYIKIPSKKIISFHIDCENKSPNQILEESLFLLENKDFSSSIVLFRFQGTLSEGKTSEINFNKIMKLCYDNGAFVVLKNTYKLQAKIFEEIGSSIPDSDNIEDETILQHLGQFKISENKDEKEIITRLINELGLESLDGEKKTVFVERVIDQAKDIMEK